MTPRPRHFVTYLRVSTARQGRSGLGLEAQQAAVADYLAANNGIELASFREVESGKVNDRPQLAAALKRCQLTRSTLLVAKLDRLSRNAAFLLNLKEAGVRFVAADLPEVNELVIGVLAVVAQAERQAISDRTKAALAAAKRRGVKLGNPGNLPASNRRTALRASHAMQAAAKSEAEKLRDVVTDARSQGCVTLRQIADHLNGLTIPTARGGQWVAASVQRLVYQLGK
jgi:DNA invertase Pin-like site-specific DNA recombinase